MQVQSIENLWKQFGPRQGSAKRRASLGSSLFDIEYFLVEKIYILKNINRQQNMKYSHRVWEWNNAMQ